MKSSNRVQRLKSKLEFKRIAILAIVITVSVLLTNTGCNKDKTTTASPEIFGSGIYIMNQGIYPSGAGTISYFNRTTMTVQQDIFNKVNKRPLGDEVQSMNIFQKKAYIVVNNAGRVEVADSATFESMGTITGLNSPRYMIGINSTKAYISDWPSSIDVVDLTNYSITKKITSGTGPEHMILYNGKVFVLNMFNSTPGIYDSTVTVIDSKMDTILTKVQLAAAPSSMCMDKNNKLWILCSGSDAVVYPTPANSTGYLIRLNPSTYTIEAKIAFPIPTTGDPAMLTINSTGDVLYYVNSNNIYSMSINSNTLPSAPFITINSNYTINALGFDNVSGYLNVAELTSWISNGYFYRYNALTGANIDNYTVGIIPGNFYFN